MSWAVGAPGIFGIGPNLTAGKETGLGGRTDEQIAPALITGTRPDGRILAPIMPRRSFAKMTKSDVAALVVSLRSLPPGKNQVLSPFGPNEEPPIYVMQLAPPASDTAAAAK